MKSTKIDREAKDRALSLETILEFEIEAYRAETQLAMEKHRAEVQAQSILNSRSWKYTQIFRALISVVLRPMLKSRRGIRVLQSLNRMLP